MSIVAENIVTEFNQNESAFEQSSYNFDALDFITGRRCLLYDSVTFAPRSACISAFEVRMNSRNMKESAGQA